MSSGWSWFVIVGTIGSLVAFFLLLHLNRHGNKPGQTTGHSYDGIEEYDNPLPAWWYWWFVLTIIFAVGYLIYYPGLGNFPGIGNWSQVGQLEEAQQAADEKYGPIFAQYGDVPVSDLQNNPNAMNMGKRLFINHCAVCHGAQGRGSFGFPNLMDEQWLWGSDDQSIKTSISDGRRAVMPPWKDILGDEGVKQVVEYVLSLSGREVDASVAGDGQLRYMTNCIACHGAKGKGNPALGAPDLTNDIWLYGGSRLRIEHVIRNGRNGEMPSFRQKLGADKVHILAAYVKSLGDEG